MSNEISRFEQDFEVDASGWSGPVTLISSDPLGGASGSNYATVEQGAFTRFGSYSSEFAGGYTTRIAVYIDVNWMAGEGFDYSVASSTQNAELPSAAGGHRRDFIFHVTKDASGVVYVNASNNAGPAPRADLGGLAGTGIITVSGWYTFEQTFRDNGDGTLAVDFKVIGSDPAPVFEKTLNESSDILDTVVGGNRYGWFVNNTVDGGLKIDSVSLFEAEGYGTPANDTIVGSAADETFYTSAGNDVIDGQGGRDTYDASGAGEGVTVDLDSNPFDAVVAGDGVAIGGASVGLDGLTSIENVRGSSFNDVINGSAGDNVFYASGGTDIINGDGNAPGNGPRGDTFDASAATTNVTINLAGQTATGFGGTSTIKNIENAVGGSGNDTITGSSANNMLVGNAGADTFMATAGSDRIDGGADADTVVFTGGSSDYTITWDGATAIVTDKANPSNVTTITNAGTLTFAGGQKVLLVGEHGEFATIQSGVNAAANGDIVLVASGLYTESVTVTDRAITIEGQGVVDVHGQFSVSDVMNDGDVLKFVNLNIDATGNSYGITVRSSATDVSGVNAGTVVLDGVDIANANSQGLFYAHPSNGSTPVNTNTIGAFVIEDSSFTDNGQLHSGARGKGHINLFGFNGDLTITDSSFSSPTDGLMMPVFGSGGTASGTEVYPHKAISVSGVRTGTPGVDGYQDSGSFTFTNVTVSGTYGSDAVSVYDMESFATDPVLDIDFVDASAPWGLVNFDGTGGTVDFSTITGENAAGPIVTPQGLASDDVFTGTSGVDVFSGRGGNDTLIGNGGTDHFVGGAGADTMTGGADADTFYYAAGSEMTGDVIDGGDGADQIIFSSTAADDTLTIGSGVQNVEAVFIAGNAGGNVDASGASALTNGLSITGDNTDNTITGTAFNDSIFGVGGDDTLIGGDGDDDFVTGSGSNSVDGGMGVDSVFYSTAANLVWTASGWSNGTDLLTGVEIVDDGATVYRIVGHNGYASIQAAIDAADAGDVVIIGEGTYAENLVIDKAITLLGSGDVHLSAASGAAISFDGVGGDVTISNIDISGSGDTAILVDDGDSIGTLTITRGSITGFSQFGLAVFGDNVGAIAMSGTELSGAGYLVKLYDYTGDASFTDVSATGTGAAGAFELIGTPNNDLGSSAPIGTVSFDNVTVDGTFTKAPVAIYNFTDADGLSVNDLDVSGATAGAGWPTVNIDGIAGNLDASGFTIVSSPMQVIALQGDKAGQPTHENTISGTAGDDLLIGHGGNDVMEGNGGNDTFWGSNAGAASIGEGNDTMIGGTGLDTAVYADTLSVGDFSVDGSGNWVLTASGSGADSLQLEIVEHAGGRYLLVGGAGGYADLQTAINASQSGDVILVTGTHSGNVNVNVAGISIVGVGNAVIQGSFNTDNGITGSTADFFQAATGYSTAAGTGLVLSADNVSISNMAIAGFNYAINLGNGIDDVSIKDVAISDSVVGINKGTAAVVTGLDITGGSITDSYMGINFAKATGSGGMATDVVIDGTHFEHLTEKGIYVETFDQSTIKNVVMDDVGTFGRGYAFAAKTPYDQTGEFGNGIDINLKYGAYSGIVIEGFTMTNVGASNGPDTVPADFGAAIGIKVRDDGSYGGVNAASYTGSVIVRDGTIDDTSTGIRAGEPGKAIAGPVVEVSGVTITGATVADIDNVTQSTMTVTAGAENDFVAAPTTTGSITFIGDADANIFVGGSGRDSFTGGGGVDDITGGAGVDTAIYADTVTIVATPAGGWTVSSASEGTDTVSGVEIIQDLASGTRTLLVGGGGFATLADALAAAVDGDTIMLSVGTHVGDATISKSVTIIGANAGVGGAGSRGAESVIDGKVTISAAGAVVVDGVKLLHDQTGSYSLGMTTSGHTVTNSVFESTVYGGATNVDRAIFVGPMASGTITITDNLITAGDNQPYGLYSTAAWRSGIWSDGGGVETIITGNTFENTRTAANLDSFTNTDSDVSGNTIVNSGTGFAFGLAATAIDSVGPNTFEGVATEFNTRNLTAPVTLDVSDDVVTNTPTDEYLLVDGSITAADTITGTSGKDYISTNGGDDLITGGAGDDIILGGAGVDTAIYNTAITTADITSGAGSFTVDGGADGTDMLAGVEIIQGTAGSILLVGNGGFASLAAAVAYAHAGDTIVLGDGAIGSGDVIIGASLAGLKIIGAGHGVDASGLDPATVAGSTYTGRIIVQADNVVIDGLRIAQGGNGGPHDAAGIVVSGSNVSISNSVFYRSGGLTDGYRAIVTDIGTGTGLSVTNSAFTGWSTGVYVNGSNGVTFTGNSFVGNNVGVSLDTYASLVSATVSGNSFDNAVENIGIGASAASFDATTLVGVNTFGGTATAVGIYALGGGAQAIIGTANADLVDGGANAFAQTVTAGLGDDNITLGSGTDTVIYNLGDGNDTIDGGADTDLLDIRASGATGPTTATISNGSVAINMATLTMSGIENVKLTLGSGAFADVVDASGFTAGTLDLTLGGGDDSYRAANGTGHVVNAGAGSKDLIDLSTMSSGVTLNLGSGSLTGVGFSQTMTGFENVRGSAFADALYGNSSANTFFATLGNDLINGGAGVDTYDASAITAGMNIDLNGIASSILFSQSLTSIENAIGTAQDDYIYGNSLANVLNGGNGNDELFGGAGNDTLTGGDGIDTAVFQGNRSQYLINYAAGTITGVDGTDSFSGIERFQFDDMLVTAVTKGDYNGNLRADILLVDSAHVDPVKGAPIVLRDGGAPGTSVDMGHVFGNTLLGVGDFDGDGKTDILQKTASGWHSFRSGGETNVNIGSVGNRSVLAVGDFNGDGKDDVLLKSPTDYLSMLDGAHANVNIGSIAGKEVVGIGDLNGDGRDDILFKSTSSSFMSYLSVTDSGLASTDLGVQNGRSLIGLADINGDGSDELVFQNANGWVSYLNGSSIGYQTNRALVGVGDFNGDGKDDLLFQSNSNGFLNYFSAGQTNVNVGLFTGQQVVGIGDYDGDGRDDILLKDSATNVVSYLSHGSASAPVVVGDITGLDIVFKDNGLGISDDMLLA
ncbi:FG-GAP repeat protein [Devosia sp. FKR38]|uniref:FG-GAP repeat protein n=1 Tax=Devosia sp. FKR38 TaxID=2562312 RepID=UPI001484E0C6|nr:FG-GAP repeat protein [Devosia sp. FKR38]